MNYWILFLLCYKAFHGAHFSVTWDASPDPTVVGYAVYYWPAESEWDAPPFREDVGKRTFVALQRRPTHAYVVAYSVGGVESQPSRTVSYPDFRWAWWLPPWPWRVQSSVDLVTWKDSSQWLWWGGVYGGFDCYATGAKFFRLVP